MKKNSTFSYILGFSLLIFFNINLNAQLWDAPIDTNKLQRLENRKILRAEPKIQQRVDEEINAYRLLMLSHEWWGIPTEREEKRLKKALDARYHIYDSPIENPSWRNTNGVFYRNQEKLEAKQNLIVMGWHPYWEGDTYKTYNFKLLTHIAFYGYEVNPFTGGYQNFQAIHNLLSSELVETAHMDTCKVLLTVSSRGAISHSVFFTSEKEVQTNLIDSLRTILRRSGADGLDLNFEDVPLQYKNHFIRFVKELSFAIREDNSAYIVSMSLPLNDKDGVYDLGKLKPWIDFFAIKGFNFHMKPTHLHEGPLSPLLTKDAAIRGSLFVFQKRTNLADLLGLDYQVTQVSLLHDDVYEERLKDSLNAYIAATYSNLEYEDYDITAILNTIKIARTIDGTPLWLTPRINRILKKTKCLAELNLRKKSRVAAKKTRFFLFEPEADVLNIKEHSLFENIEQVKSEVDSQMQDLGTVIQQYKNKIGAKHQSSLILALPYHGAVWYRDRAQKHYFEGYIPYSEILKLVEDDKAAVDYDKSTHSLIATLRDSVGGVYRIYFDNSTSLGRKYDFAINQGLGGVGLWALGADYSHIELWATLEESFVSRRVWNEELGRDDRIKVEKVNKIQYTIQYLLKHFSPLTFATLFFITIFICISFCFSVLDWKVRDVLFYSGAFRIFYLALFMVIVLVLGNMFSVFQYSTTTFFIGVGLGLVLTWTASNLVENRHEKLP